MSDDGEVRLRASAVPRLPGLCRKPWALVGFPLLVATGLYGNLAVQPWHAPPAHRTTVVATEPPASPDPELSLTPARSPSPSPESRVAQPVAPVAPLRARISTDVLIRSTRPLSRQVVRQLVLATRARAALPVAFGRVQLATGGTAALAVDASTFRAWTPKGTAESDAVWRSVAGGEGSVAHVVARAFLVKLGSTVSAARAGRETRLRVGSFATTGVPGVGLVVDGARGRQLGLVPGTGLLLSAPQRDPVVTAALARDVLQGGAQAIPVQVDRPASGRWVAPVAGHVTSLFGPRAAPLPGGSTFHEGLDIGAPLGAPVYAMSDGDVLYAGPASGFGQEIVLSHRGAVTTVYGHMSRLLLSAGHVAVGQPIALVGSEGESTGPHLHVEVRIHDQPTDPLAWLRAHRVPVT